MTDGQEERVFMPWRHHLGSGNWLQEIIAFINAKINFAHPPAIAGYHRKDSFTMGSCITLEKCNYYVSCCSLATISPSHWENSGSNFVKRYQRLAWKIWCNKMIIDNSTRHQQRYYKLSVKQEWPLADYMHKSSKYVLLPRNYGNRKMSGPSWRSTLMCNNSTSAGTSLDGTPMFAHVTLHHTFNPLGSKCPYWQDEDAAS